MPAVLGSFLILLIDCICDLIAIQDVVFLITLLSAQRFSRKPLLNIYFYTTAD